MVVAEFQEDRVNLLNLLVFDKQKILHSKRAVFSFQDVNLFLKLEKVLANRLETSVFKKLNLVKLNYIRRQNDLQFKILNYIQCQIC